MSSAITESKAVLKWRVVDIAVASVIGVASALIYWVVAIATAAPWSALEAIIPGLAGVFNGLWLFAGPLAAIIVRKPGAAVYAEVVAGVLEALMGNMWGGVETFLIALVQGLFAEIAFLIFATVTLSLFGMMSEMLYFGVPPLMAVGSHTWQYENLVSGPVTTFIGDAFFDIRFLLISR